MAIAILTFLISGSLLSPSKAFLRTDASTNLTPPTQVEITDFDSNSVRLKWLAPITVETNEVRDYVIRYREYGYPNWLVFSDEVSTQTIGRVDHLLTGHLYEFQIGAVYGTETLWSLQDDQEMTGAIGISAGSTHACAIKMENRISCWGTNGSGQLGALPHLGDFEGSRAVGVIGLTGTVKSVALGDQFSCALLGDETVACWGWTVGGKNFQKIQYLRNVISVDAGVKACAVTSDGNVSCWGRNFIYDGALPEETPVRVNGITNATSVSVGQNHACAVIIDGTVTCWGYNGEGQLGGPCATNPCDMSVPQIVPDLFGVRSVSVGQNHTCALLNNGTVSCWGSNRHMQLGHHPQSSGGAPNPVVGLTNVEKISAGNEFTCVVDASKAVNCWGRGDYGQLGNIHNSSGDSYLPSQVPGLTDVEELSVGNNFACALEKGGAVLCWGRNESGQLGNGQRGAPWGGLEPVNVVAQYPQQIPSRIPEPPIISSITSVAKSVQRVELEVVDDGGQAVTERIYEWSSDGGVHWNRSPLAGPLQIFPMGSDTAVRVALVNSVGQSDWSQLSVGEVISIPPSAKNLSAESVSSSSVKLTWQPPDINGGANVTDYVVRFRIVGSPTWEIYEDGVSRETSTTVNELLAGREYEFQVGAVNHKGIGWEAPVSPSVSRTSSCIVRSTNKLACWGDNDFGELGNGTTVSSNSPVETLVAEGVTSVISGFSHRCVTTLTYALLCWGLNSRGQVGDDSRLTRLAPVKVLPDGSVLRADAGGEHTCALMTSRFVKCWGDNTFGQLGIGGVDDSSLPEIVQGLTDVVEVSAGATHTCAVLTDGTAKCWGDNSFGQVGIDGTDNVLIPTQVQDLYDVVQISAGLDHTCALLTTGRTKCWGRNWAGALGDGTQKSRSKPVSTEAPESISVQSGDLFTCSLTFQGIIYCWGKNSNQELGNGRYNNSFSLDPSRVSSTLGAALLSERGASSPHPFSGGGVQHSCSATGDGEVMCWGGTFGATAEQIPLPYTVATPVDRYTITFVYNFASGGNALEHETYLSGGVEVNLPIPTRVGYSFAGWFEDSGFRGQKLGLTYAPNQTITLYASWIKNPIRAFATTKPTLSGTAKVSQTLNLNKGSWVGYPYPTFTFQWFSCATQVKAVTQTIPKVCKAISNATQSKLVVTKALKGKFLAVSVTGASKGTPATKWLSISTSKVS